jgi:hypothetical protein
MRLAYDRQYSCLMRQKCAELTSNDSEKHDEAGTAAQSALETHFGDSRSDSYNIMHLKNVQNTGKG